MGAVQSEVPRQASLYLTAYGGQPWRATGCSASVYCTSAPAAASCGGHAGLCRSVFATTESPSLAPLQVLKGGFNEWAKSGRDVESDEE